MNLYVYNTITGKKEKFRVKNNFVKMYSCGPTVYDYDHLGHARFGIFYDVVRRYLKFLGYKIKFVQNITDVGHLTETETGEDKIIKKAQEEKKDPREIAKIFEKYHFNDMKSLNVSKPDISPRASEFIPQIIKFIRVLIKKGYAYETNSGVYFDVSKFEKYGKLSKRIIDKSLSGTRVILKEDKKNSEDFALWRKSEPNHILKWNSPWGMGYPGWHIECSVMNHELLGEPIDIHGGAIELSFPHHENEIAQSESYQNKQFVRYWLHIGLVTVNDEKMSKSIGNVIRIKDIIKKYDFNTLRLALLSTHYRKPFDYSEKIIKQNEILVNKLIQAKFNNSLKKDNDQKILLSIQKALNNDFNTPLAVQIWFKSRNKISKSLFEKIETIFGLKLDLVEIPTEINKLAKKREDLRKKQDWAKADEIRKSIEVNGYSVEDIKNGYKIIKKSNK